MTKRPFNIAFFGSSLVSAYWNGAATYYRGIISALHQRGHGTVFYEPDAYDRQRHRDIGEPSYARSMVYRVEDESGVREALGDAAGADIVIKASGVGVFDELLEDAVAGMEGVLRVFWDVDAPATLDRAVRDTADPFRSLIPFYDLILTYGGGPPVVKAYEALGAKRCIPVYNALDPSTHFPVPREERFAGTLGFLGNRMPDREERVHEFFFKAARRMPGHRFLLGGNGWDSAVEEFPNIAYFGHVYTREHNAFNCSPMAVLNVNRESMARYGFSPPTRVFEAAGAESCLLTDAWEGIEEFLEPDRECLVCRSGEEVVARLTGLDPARAGQIGAAARKRVLRDHTYDRRGAQVETIFEEAAGGTPWV
jgi:spore maturation protein CgeB